MLCPLLYSLAVLTKSCRCNLSSAKYLRHNPRFLIYMEIIKKIYGVYKNTPWNSDTPTKQLDGVVFLHELSIFAVILLLWMLILQALQKYSLSHCVCVYGKVLIHLLLIDSKDNFTSSVAYHSKNSGVSHNILGFEVYKYWYRTCFPSKFVRLTVNCTINVSSQSGIVSDIALSKPHKIRLP